VERGGGFGGGGRGNAVGKGLLMGVVVPGELTRWRREEDLGGDT